MANRCDGTTQKGVRCARRTKHESGRCHSHREASHDTSVGATQHTVVEFVTIKPEEGCAVCYGSLDNEKDPLKPCGHWVHFECLRKWGKKECPVCRKSVKNVEMEVENEEEELLAQNLERLSTLQPAGASIQRLGLNPRQWIYASEAHASRLILTMVFGATNYFDNVCRILSRTIVDTYAVDEYEIVNYVIENLHTFPQNGFAYLD